MKNLIGVLWVITYMTGGFLTWGYCTNTAPEIRGWHDPVPPAAYAMLWPVYWAGKASLKITKGWSF